MFVDRFAVIRATRNNSPNKIKLLCASLLLASTPALSWAQSADLVANNAGPTTSAAGAQFTYVVKLSNNGLGGADGATFIDTLPTGATGVSATCTAATGGAQCPSGANLVATNTQISGNIPNFPNQGAVEITITGNYGVPSPTSVSSTVNLTPPAGLTETHPETNASTVNTTLITDAKLIVNKTQSTVGGTTIYTITLKNEGNAAADGAIFRDYLGTSVTGTNAGYRASVDINYESCSATGGAQCPAAGAFTSFTGATNNYQRSLFNTSVPKLPSGSSVTVVYSASITPSAQCGLTTANLSNVATITPPNGITNQFGTASSTANVSVPGTDACPPTPAWNYDLTKTQAKVLPDGTIIPIGLGTSYAYTYGDTIRYTVTVVNNGLVAADGAKLRDWTNSVSGSAQYANLKAHYVPSCIAENGAECPLDSSFPTVDRGGATSGSSGNVLNDGDLFNVAIPKFPVGGKITVVYDAVLTPSAFCGLAASTFRNSASIQAPPGSTGFTGKETGYVNMSVPATSACPDIRVTKTQSTASPQPGVPFTYEVVITNPGPDAVDGAQWHDYMHTSGFAQNLKAKIAYDGCVAEGGAQCPADSQFAAWDSQSLSSFNYLVKSGTTIPKLPVQGKIILRYRVTLEELSAASCSSASGTITNFTQVTPPNGRLGKSASVSMPIICADVGITKTVTPIFVKAGEPMTYTVVVSNAGLGAAPNVLFSDPLPSIFEYESAACEMIKESAPPLPHPRTECGASVDYDSATRTLSSTIKSIGQLGEIKFTIKGKAGVIPGTYKNEALATLPPGLFDPIMATNKTDVNVQIANTQSAITVKKLVTGLEAAGLPAPMTFTGNVTCGVQPSQSWSIMVPAGASSGTSAPLTFYDTEACTVTEDTPPLAPPGYEWVGSPTIVNSTDPLGPQTPREVPVTNTLNRQTASLALTKVVTGTAAAVAKVNGSFEFALNCGTDGSFSTSVVIANGASNSNTISGIPTGATCVVSETKKADAPAGYQWLAPVFETNPVVIPGVGGTVTFKATNPLERNVAGLTITKRITGPDAGIKAVNGSFAFAVNCGADGVFNTTVAIINGASGSVTISGLPAGATCQVSETSKATAPTGYEWDAPVISPDSIVIPSAGGSVTVGANNPLKRQAASLTLTKLISGPDAVVQKTSGKFAFAIDCGVDGKFDTEVEIANGASNSVTMDNLPSGASCQISETLAANSPSGYTWDKPVYETNPVLVPAKGAMATFKVTNVLKSGTPTTIEPVPALGGPLLSALVTLMSMLGVWLTHKRLTSTADASR
ncbi:DUF5979 domain-containing protein [Comamonas odontotermitis]|uniref:DUF5979 domain-containing protein n=1 Tax=Comamonas odontotermitis TaxID=379895 RepID=UPI001CC71CAD|nr:DUF5979 domain-containing protein [Comamonas odontotermitis]UBB15773.1 DUF11 domain-containing protein [Comamonas odontotermitis]